MEQFTEINNLHFSGIHLDAIIGRVASESHHQRPPQRDNHAYVCIDPLPLHEVLDPLHEGEYPCIPLRMDFASHDLYKLVNGVFNNIIFDAGVVNRVNGFFGAIFEWYRLLSPGGKLYIQGMQNVLDFKAYRRELLEQNRVFVSEREQRIWEGLKREAFKELLTEVCFAAGFVDIYEGRMNDGHFPIDTAGQSAFPNSPYFVFTK